MLSAAIIHRVQNCHPSSYLCDLLTSYKPARTLRSSCSNLLAVPNRVKTVTASRAFRVAAPIIWICLTLLKLQIRSMFLRIV
jgi:hypothetical protein